MSTSPAVVPLPRDLSAEAIEDALRGRSVGARVVVLGEVGSTMDEAARLADQGAPDGTVVLADHQTAGRGRFERPWVDRPGAALLLSVLFRPVIAAEAWHALPRAVGLAALDALGPHVPVGRSLGLKWPNDVLVDDAKIAGLLAEARTAAGAETATLVVGLGINVARSRQDLPEGATSLASLGIDAPARQDLAIALLLALDGYVLRLRDGNTLLEEWSSRLETLGRRVRVTSSDGTWEGTAVGVDASGALVVEVGDRRRVAVRAGDVTLADRR